MGKKWEEIEYSDIKIGDTIRHTVEMGEVSYITIVGEVDTSDGQDGSFRLNAGQWIFPDDIYVNEDGATAVTVERKKAEKPKFIYPEGVGSVVKGVSNSGMKRAGWFIKVGVDKYYNSKSGAFYNEHEIDLFYTNLEVVYESNVKEGEDEKGS